jgi:hypothetical protein
MQNEMILYMEDGEMKKYVEQIIDGVIAVITTAIIFGSLIVITTITYR